MGNKRRARIKTDDDGNYCIGLSNGRVAIVDQYNGDHARLTELLDRIEDMAQPSPQKIAADAAKAEFKEARRAKHEDRIARASSSGIRAYTAPKERQPKKRQWEMTQLGRRIGRMGR